MLTRKVDTGYMIRLVRGEKLMESLAKHILENKIPSGSLTGLGAVCNTVLGYYDLSQKKYFEKKFPDEMELASLVGNISYFEGKPIVHAHATISNTDLQAFAGHLFETETAVTVEISLNVTDAKIERKFDPDIGLNLLDL